jgi:endonuclease YncB( thermonuclease family)
MTDQELMCVHPGTPATKFPFGDRIYRVRVVSVYDGDTVQVVFKHDSTYFQFGLRILGIDTPELHGTSGATKIMAEAAREYARKTIMSSETSCLHYALFTDYDKYGGRILGHLYLSCPDSAKQDKSFASLMLQQGLAVPYSGSTKIKDWDTLANAWCSKAFRSI